MTKTKTHKRIVQLAESRKHSQVTCARLPACDTMWQIVYIDWVTSEGSALPHSACHQLERTGGDLLSCSGHADDDALPPTFVAGLQGRSLKQTR